MIKLGAFLWRDAVTRDQTNDKKPLSLGRSLKRQKFTQTDLNGLLLRRALQEGVLPDVFR